MKRRRSDGNGPILKDDAVFGGKIVPDNERLEEIVRSCKSLGLRIVLTQGSWDLIHIGHARYMCEAKKHGDILVVGVDSDEKIRIRKGPDRPIVPQQERLEMVSHLRYVDFVALKRHDDPKWNLIKLVRPDVLVVTKRQEYTEKQIAELKKYCGEIIQLESQATTSTSAKIRDLQINTAQKLEKALTPRLVKTIKDVLGGID